MLIKLFSLGSVCKRGNEKIAIINDDRDRSLKIEFILIDGTTINYDPNSKRSSVFRIFVTPSSVFMRRFVNPNFTARG